MEVQVNPPRMDAEKLRKQILLFIGLSLVVHFGVLTGLYFTQLKNEYTPPEAVFVDLNAVPPQPMSAEDREKAGQVVESEQVADSTPPKEAKYLGERDQTVQEETKAKEVDSFRKGGAPSRAGGGGKDLSLKNLAARQAFTPPSQAEIDGYKERLAKREEAASAPNGPMGENNKEGAASNDYLKDVKDGERTALSTKEFVYFSYFQRIRRQLEVAWNSRLRSTMETHMVGGRQLATDRDYITGVVVVLDRFGRVTGVQVMQRSGATALDDAAVDAFNQAGPFPNPPEGLIDQKGEIHIPWNFVLQS